MKHVALEERFRQYDYLELELSVAQLRSIEKKESCVISTSGSLLDTRFYFVRRCQATVID